MGKTLDPFGEKGSFPLHISYHLYTVRVTEYWNRLPRKVVESPSLETFENLLNIAMGNWLYEFLLEQERLDQMAFRGPFQPQPFCDYVSHNITRVLKALCTTLSV